MYTNFYSSAEYEFVAYIHTKFVNLSWDKTLILFLEEYLSLHPTNLSIIQDEKHIFPKCCHNIFIISLIPHTRYSSFFSKHIIYLYCTKKTLFFYMY